VLSLELRDLDAQKINMLYEKIRAEAQQDRHGQQDQF
jgi:hypothetical protein